MMWFLSSNFLQTQIQMTDGDCSIFKLLGRGVNRKRLMCFDSESPVFKFLRRSVYEAINNASNRMFIAFITRKALMRECFSLYRVRISNNLTSMEQNPRQVNNKVKLFLLFNFAGDDLTVSHLHDKRMQNFFSNSKQDLWETTIPSTHFLQLVWWGEGRVGVRRHYQETCIILYQNFTINLWLYDLCEWN